MVEKTPIDVPFKVKEGSGKGTVGGPVVKDSYPFNDKKTGDIPGVKDAGPSLSEQLEQTKLKKELEFEKKKLRDAERLNKKPGFFGKQVGIVTSARKYAHQKRQLSLERRQNVATAKANIAVQKQNVFQAKTVRAEGRLKLLEIKKARRDFLKSQHLERDANRARPLSDKGVRGKSLLGKVKGPPVTGSNPVSGQGGFFAGVKRQPAPIKGGQVSRRSNPVSGSGGFFAGVGKKSGKKKGGFFG